MSEVRTGPAKRSRGKAILIAVIALAALLALAAATQDWLEISLEEGAAAFSRMSVTGQKLNPSISPIAIAALASALVLTIAGPVFRRVLGVVTLLLGGGIAWLGASVLSDPFLAPSTAVAEATGISGGAQYELVRSIEATSWPALALVAGAVTAVAGLLVLLVGGRWRSAGRKYQTPAEAATRTAGSDAEEDRDRIAEWDALSDGDDPT